MSPGGPETVRSRVEAALVAPLAALGLDLESVELTPAGKRRVLRVAVDKDGGVTLDDVAEATTAVGAVIEESGVMGERPYTLEVTSRGVDRPLTLPRHWRRNLGRLVEVTLADGTRVLGRIHAASEAAVVVTTASGDHEIAMTDVGTAHVQIEFNRREEES